MRNFITDDVSFSLNSSVTICLNLCVLSLCTDGKKVKKKKPEKDKEEPEKEKEKEPKKKTKSAPKKKKGETSMFFLVFFFFGLILTFLSVDY